MLHTLHSYFTNICPVLALQRSSDYVIQYADLLSTLYHSPHYSNKRDNSESNYFKYKEDNSVSARLSRLSDEEIIAKYLSRCTNDVECNDDFLSIPVPTPKEVDYTRFQAV